MERIQRALELARAQRSEAASGARIASHAAPAISDLQLTPAHLEAHRIVDPLARTTAAHAYRMLRARLLPQIRQNHARVIGIVSASDGDGKTLTAINLSMSLAADPSHSVVLVDFDLRNPSVAKTLGLPADLGLETWFEQAQPVERLMRRVVGQARLILLPTYRAVARSSERLSNPATHELLKQIVAIDPTWIVVVDLPPALLSDDYLALARSLDGVIMVVSEGRSQRDDLVAVRELVGPNKILGAVVNRSSEHERRVY